MPKLACFRTKHAEIYAFFRVRACVKELTNVMSGILVPLEYKFPGSRKVFVLDRWSAVSLLPCVPVSLSVSVSNFYPSTDLTHFLLDLSEI